MTQSVYAHVIMQRLNGKYAEWFVFSHVMSEILHAKDVPVSFIILSFTNAFQAVNKRTVLHQSLSLGKQFCIRLHMLKQNRKRNSANQFYCIICTRGMMP